ncbi:MAG: hypothetical protein ALECFALPRED_008953 [Alectoria fallacina]|uniref:Uncharacterized protein n=1 Tax=Alectoria fallacina TaxID=1903189 RepID=A0A8H3J581_9LECA|nr:MAG: hypothetical protein ALECFALPRED_008953 [Alectoria fallacina]
MTRATLSKPPLGQFSFILVEIDGHGLQGREEEHYSKAIRVSATWSDDWYDRMAEKALERSLFSSLDVSRSREEGFLCAERVGKRVWRERMVLKERAEGGFERAGAGILEGERGWRAEYGVDGDKGLGLVKDAGE